MFLASRAGRPKSNVRTASALSGSAKREQSGGGGNLLIRAPGRSGGLSKSVDLCTKPLLLHAGRSGCFVPEIPLGDREIKQTAGFASFGQGVMKQPAFGGMNERMRSEYSWQFVWDNRGAGWDSRRANLPMSGSRRAKSFFYRLARRLSGGRLRRLDQFLGFRQLQLCGAMINEPRQGRGGSQQFQSLPQDHVNAFSTAGHRHGRGPACVQTEAQRRVKGWRPWHRIGMITLA